LRQLGILKLIAGEPAAALAEFQQGLDAARTAGHLVAEGLNLWGIAQVQAHRGAFAEAHATADTALGCFAAIGWRRGAVNVLSFLGDVKYQEGKWVEAQSLLEQSLAIAHELGAESLYCSALVRLGQIATERGDLGQASTLLAESLRSSARIADRESLAAGLSTCALIATSCMEWRRALIVASAASKLRPGPARGGPTSATRERPGVGQLLERQVEKARAALGAQAAADAWAAGETMSWDSATAEGLAICASAHAADTSHGAGHG
jgi:tetratricopeptide (TPR) repeat protein